VPPPAGAWKSASPDGSSNKRSLLNSEPAENSTESRFKPPADSHDEDPLGSADIQPADHESYAGLMSLSGPKRTHSLARLLHRDHVLGDVSAPALTLDHCLARAAPGTRRRAVEAFWSAREQAARCQVFSDQNDQLAALYPIVLHNARRPGGAEAMLDLRASQQAAEADLLDAQSRLLQRQLDLAMLTGRESSSKEWPLPVTPPHGGRYEMRLDAQPQQLVQSSAVRSLATIVPGLYAALEDRSEAIIRLDGQRAAAAESLQTGPQRIDLAEPLELIDRQALESLAFLSTLTRYNLAIADYALAVLPAATPADLTAAMVVKK
jgi:hypothetical protein